MRRRYLVISAALPSAHALSLANFQQITTILLPSSCSSAYDGQIPSCTVSDFQNSCSIACQSGLNQVAQNVQSGCSNLILVNSNSLLGIVLDGGIIQALCTSVQTSTTTVVRTTTAAQESSAAESVTLPTASPGVTGGLGTTATAVASTTTRTSTAVVASSTAGRTTTVRSTTAISSAAAASSTSVDSTSEAITSEATTTAATSEASGGAATDLSLITSTSTTKTSKSSPSQNAKPDTGNSGGGSPFDISSGASRSECKLLGVSTVALLAAIFLVR